MSVEINIAKPYQDLVSAARLRSAVVAVLAHEQSSGDVTIVVSDEATIADLNERFLGHTGPTDVLSFPARSEGSDFAEPPETAPYLGDIIIAYPYAAAQASQRGAPIAAELDLLVVHGCLHLLGYDHAEPDEKAAMWEAQAAILRTLTPAS